MAKKIQKNLQKSSIKCPVKFFRRFSRVSAVFFANSAVKTSIWVILGQAHVTPANVLRGVKKFRDFLGFFGRKNFSRVSAVKKVQKFAKKNFRNLQKNFSAKKFVTLAGVISRKIFFRRDRFSGFRVFFLSKKKHPLTSQIFFVKNREKKNAKKRSSCL